MESYLDRYDIKIEKNLFVTSKNATSGTILLTQAPLASVPFPSERQNRCNYCLRKGNLQCCSRCHSAYFCSNDCFLNAWIHFHRSLCLQQDNLLERTAFTLDNFKSLKQEDSFLQLSIDILNQLQLPESNLIDEEFIKNAMNSTQWSLNDLKNLWHRIQIASFPITDPDHQLDPIATGIYPLTTQYVRHSCRPNTGLIYKQGYQLLVALENIPANTPITISYVDLLATKQQRQIELNQRFGAQFHCDCSRCEGEFQGLDQLLKEETNDDKDLESNLESQLKSWNVLEMIKIYAVKDLKEQQVLDVPHLSHFISRMIAPDIYVPALKGKKTTLASMYYHRLPPLSQLHQNNDDTKRILPVIEALLKLPRSPFMSISGIKTAEKLLKKLILQERWVEASRCTIYLFMMYRLIYPTTLYPKLVYHSLILTRASWNSLVQLELAGIGKKLESIYQDAVRLWILVARNSILKVFGQDTCLWRDVVEIKWLFERDQKLKLN